MQLRNSVAPLASSALTATRSALTVFFPNLHVEIKTTVLVISSFNNDQVVGRRFPNLCVSHAVFLLYFVIFYNINKKDRNAQVRTTSVAVIADAGLQVHNKDLCRVNMQDWQRMNRSWLLKSQHGSFMAIDI